MGVEMRPGEEVPGLLDLGWRQVQKIGSGLSRQEGEDEEKQWGHTSSKIN